MGSGNDKAKRWRPWQFSLRTLLALTLAVACFSGWLVRESAEIEAEAAARARVDALGGTQISQFAMSLHRPDYGTENIPAQTTLRLPPSREEWDRKRDRSQVHWGLVPFTLGESIEDKDLELLTALPHIRYLDLTFTDIGNEGVTHLQRMKNIEVLILDHTRITDDGLRSLRNLPQLRVLSLAQTDVGDLGMEFVAGMDQLEYLDLNGTRVTSVGLNYLVDMDALKVRHGGQVRMARFRPTHPKTSTIPSRT